MSSNTSPFGHWFSSGVENGTTSSDSTTPPNASVGSPDSGYRGLFNAQKKLLRQREKDWKKYRGETENLLENMPEYDIPEASWQYQALMTDMATQLAGISDASGGKKNIDFSKYAVQRPAADEDNSVEDPYSYAEGGLNRNFLESFKANAQPGMYDKYANQMGGGSSYSDEALLDNLKNYVSGRSAPQSSSMSQRLTY